MDGLGFINCHWPLTTQNAAPAVREPPYARVSLILSFRDYEFEFLIARIEVRRDAYTGDGAISTMNPS